MVELPKEHIRSSGKMGKAIGTKREELRRI